MNQNMYKRLLLLGWLWLLLSAGVYAQIGSWRSHVSYRSAQSVALAGQYVYAATANGLFAYDKTTGETITLTRQDGLSDVGISRLLYLPDQSRLLIAYRTGTIDLLSLTVTGEPGSIQTISTIATANNLPDARGINFINRVNNLAYLSTDFGLVVLNLAANDIRDTYFSRRSNGSVLPIYQTTVVGDSLYALTAPLSATATTPQAIRAVRLASETNLADPANWRIIGNPPGSPRTLVTRQGRVSTAVSGQGIYDRSGGGWTLTQAASTTLVRQFSSNSSADPETVVFIGQTVTASTIGMVSSPLLADPRDVVVDGTSLWIADGQSGLLLVSAGAVRAIAPAGPDRDTFSTLYAYTDRLVALPNGPQDATALSASQTPAGQLQVSANQWQSLSAQGAGQGFSAAAYLPTTQTLYLGGYGTGLWQQTADQPMLVNIPLPVAVGEYITSLAADGLGNLWIATGGSLARTATLHVRRPDGTFTSFPTVTEQSIQQLVPDDGGYIWIRLSVGSGLLVFDPQTNRLRPLTTVINGGGLLTNSVRALAKDRLGAIWVGTDLGPTVFDNLSDPFVGAINARPPYSNRIRLLINELITAIVVDGGNRKWLSTRTGVYRVSPDGSQLLETLTDDTSPLPLRSISALAVEPLSGRLFIQTTNGLISYQTTATEPADALSTPTIFPNPVRPDFTGSVGITGLTDNATVKILDAGGQLVYETRSQGGTAAWNLLDYRGRPAQTGVYLVVVVTATGTEGVAGKLAVVR